MDENQDTSDKPKKQWFGSMRHIFAVLGVSVATASVIAWLCPSDVSLPLIAITGFGITVVAGVCRAYAHGHKSERDAFDYAGKLLGVGALIFTGVGVAINFPAAFGGWVPLVCGPLLVILTSTLVVRWSMWRAGMLKGSTFISGKTSNDNQLDHVPDDAQLERSLEEHAGSETATPISSGN